MEKGRSEIEQRLDRLVGEILPEPGDRWEKTRALLRRISQSPDAIMLLDVLCSKPHFDALSSDLRDRNLCGEIGIPIPPRDLRGLTGPADLDRFLAIGEAAAHNIYPFLSTNPRILDVGCGCGKIPRFFVANPKIHYVGFDILPESIEWATQAFERYSDRFRFEYVDVFNQVYNPDGQLMANNFTFPYLDNEFDFVICGSLFTHLLQEDMDHYLAEISRCLAPKGRLWASIHSNVKDDEAPFSGDESRIDMTDDFWRQACRKHGLTLHYYIGLLCGQYVYVMQKSAAEDQNKMHTLRSSEEHPQSCQSTGDQLANEIAALSEMVGEGRAEIAEFRRSVETALEIGWEEIRMLTRQSRPLLPIFSGRRTRGKPQK